MLAPGRPTCTLTGTLSGYRDESRGFFFQAEDGIRDWIVTGVQTCALPICAAADRRSCTFPRRILPGMTPDRIAGADDKVPSRLPRREAARSRKFHQLRHPPSLCARYFPSEIGRASCRERV